MLWCIDGNVFDKSIFYFIQRFECYTTLIVKQFLENECSVTLEMLDKIKYGFVENVLINAP